MRVLVLPGMDGGAELSEEFRARMARWYAVDFVEYDPGGAPVETVVAALEGSEATVVVAESFSGAVALRALQRPEARRGVLGLVLAFSFVVSPTAAWMRPFARDFVFRRPPPEWAIRVSMAGRGGDPSLVRRAIARAGGTGIAERVRGMRGLDVRDELAAVELPMLSLRATGDRLVRAESAPEAHRAMDLQRVPSAHLGLHVAPERCAELIRDWIGSLAV